MKSLKDAIILYLLIILSLIAIITSIAPIILLAVIWVSNVHIIFKILGSLLLPLLSIVMIELWQSLDDKIDDKR